MLERHDLRRCGTCTSARVWTVIGLRLNLKSISPTPRTAGTPSWPMSHRFGFTAAVRRKRWRKRRHSHFVCWPTALNTKTPETSLMGRLAGDLHDWLNGIRGQFGDVD